MTSFEIFFHDLNEDARGRYLKFCGVSDPDEINADLCPLCTIDLEDRLEDEGFCGPDPRDNQV